MEEPMITPNRKPQIKALIISKLSKKLNFNNVFLNFCWGRADRENRIQEKPTLLTV